jgi:hypothetical protein
MHHQNTEIQIGSSLFFVSSHKRKGKELQATTMRTASIEITLCLVLFLVLALVPYASAAFGKRSGKNGRDNKNEKNDEDEATNRSVRGAARVVKEHERGLQISELSASVASFFVRHRETTFDGDTAASSALKKAIETTANSNELREFLTTTRRALHRDPEVMYELPHTSKTITSILEELEISYSTGWAKNTHPEHFPGPGGYGVVAHIGSKDPTGPCIILRADST